MDALVMWVFLALIQAQGPVGAGFGSEATCREAVVEMAKMPDVVAISECIPIKLAQKVTG